ncbi:MAG: hypothetical protein KGQ93_02880 [Cyanobacteria bacterium REEB459]|nr:hypothetical protein [Cyanobacteria bacterium REEB459]
MVVNLCPISYIELKVWKAGRPHTLAQDLEQLDRYLAGWRSLTKTPTCLPRRSAPPPAPSPAPEGRGYQGFRARAEGGGRRDQFKLVGR